MTRSKLFRPVLVMTAVLVATPAIASGINAGNNGMPSRLSMTCTTPNGKAVTDPAACAAEGCVDAQGKRVTDASICAAPPAPAAEPAQRERQATKSRSNIQNN